MTKEEFFHLLEKFKNGKLSGDELVSLIFPGESFPDSSNKGFVDLGHTRVDTSRLKRVGFPEVVLCQNKNKKEIQEIVEELYRHNGFVLLTRANDEHYKLLKIKFQDTIYYSEPGIIVIGKPMELRGKISVLTGGTSDRKVAEEAAITAQVLGCNVRRIYDAGVAGLHRLLAYKTDIEDSNAIVAVAGMEGALPSVIAGLFGIPVIGVPTSIGYGANFGGITPLLTMLNSCAPGVCVVNIDNGFGAGYLAALINKKIEDKRKKVE